MTAWAGAAAAFAVAAGVNALPALNRGLRDRLAAAPEERWAETPVPAVGGIGIIGGVAAGLAVLGAPPVAWQLFGAAAIGFAVGLADDRLELTPRLKLGGQLAAAVVVAAAGVTPDLGAPGWVEWVAAVVWVLVVVNAVNLVDNMDGLAAGTVAIAAVTLLGWSVRFLDTTPEVAVAVAAAAAGFLVWNVHPARLFMGDSGSLFLGVMLAGLTLMDAGGSGGDLRLALAVPVALVAYPVFDVVLVVVDRLRRGDPVSRGGRDHSSHRLVRTGWSQRAAVGAWWVVGALSGVVAYLARDLSTGQWWLLAAGLAAVYGVLGVALLRVPADG